MSDKYADTVEEALERLTGHEFWANGEPGLSGTGTIAHGGNNDVLTYNVAVEKFVDPENLAGYAAHLLEHEGDPNLKPGDPGQTIHL